MVYIAGRNQLATGKGGDRAAVFRELRTSVFSACLFTSRPLHVHIFMSTFDTNTSDAAYPGCNLCWLAAMCASALPLNTAMRATPVDGPMARFTLQPLGTQILEWFRDDLDTIGFSHKSTWFGYSKLWLPRLLPAEDWVAFIDTDTVFVRDPWALLDMRHTVMGPTHHIAAIVTPGMGFTARINSGVMVMALGRLRASNWAEALRASVQRNRGWPVGAAVDAATEVRVFNHSTGTEGVVGKSDGVQSGSSLILRPRFNASRDWNCDAFHWGRFPPGHQLCLSVSCLDLRDNRNWTLPTVNSDRARAQCESGTELSDSATPSMANRWLVSELGRHSDLE